MGIELRIKSFDAEGKSTTSVKRISEYDITVGCYNDDSVKLKSQLLQGSHIRISSEWNADTGGQRLIITNISGNTSIFVDNEALESDEYREINETSEILLGKYTLAARDTSMSLFSSAEQSTSSDFALESFSPNEFSFDTAMQSLLQPAEKDQVPEEQQSTPAMAMAIPDDKLTTSEATVAVTAEAPQSETAPCEVLTTDIAPLPSAKKPEQTANTSNVVALAADKNNEQTNTDSSKKQTLFEGVVGLDDIVELNFVAYRLYSISGQIVHRKQALAGVVLDGGALGISKTDINGNYRFENIVENTQFQITASLDGYMMDKDPVVSGTIEDNIEHNFSAIKLSRIAGRIVHGGTPLPGITLDAGPHGTCITDPDGYYQFDNVPENTELEIRALGAGFMFKRANNGVAKKAATPSTAKPVTMPTTPVAAIVESPTPELDDSLAALVGDRQNVA